MLGEYLANENSQGVVSAKPQTRTNRMTDQDRQTPALPLPNAPPSSKPVVQVEIYGASDDLIVIEGPIGDEFSPTSDEGPSFVAFSDGTLLSIEYGDSGIWRISPMVMGSASYAHDPGTSPDGHYTDRVTLVGILDWVVVGPRWRGRDV